MKTKIIIFLAGLFAMLSALIFLAPTAMPHGGGNWNGFTIDVVNDTAEAQVTKTQLIVSDIIRGRQGTDDWPLPSLREQRDSLITAKEEVDEVLEQYVTDGINVQQVTELHSKPRVGRTVAASRALGASIALLERAGTVDTRDNFIAEFYSGGPAARLYELLEAHVDRMALYSLLTGDNE